MLISKETRITQQRYTDFSRWNLPTGYLSIRTNRNRHRCQTRDHELAECNCGDPVSSGSELAVFPPSRLRKSVLRFVDWLDRYGETSYDFQTFYASDLARSAKALYYRHPLLGMMAVAPIVFCEAFVPGARRLFWKRQRFPIADAHYAMGFAFLSQVFGRKEYYNKAVHFLEVLKSTRCPGYNNYCWGYPFNWETIRGTIREGTPLITTVPYVYEAFREVWRVDHKG